MRLKGADRQQVRKWRQQQKENGYLPHYHKVGRILMEVRFCPKQPRLWWCVINLVTGEHLTFHKTGLPLEGRGRLVGPLIRKGKIKRGNLLPGS